MFGEWLLGVAVACLLARLWDEPADRAAFAGWVLQIGGLSTALVALWQLPVIFKKPSFGAELRAWADQLPRLLLQKPRNIVLQVDPVRVGLHVGDITLSQGAPPPRTIEERVASLEQNLERVEAMLRTHQKEAGQRFDEIQKELRRESADLRRTLKDLDERQLHVEIGGLHQQLVGLAWFLFGTTWGTLPGPSAHFFGFLFGS